MPDLICKDCQKTFLHAATLTVNNDDFSEFQTRNCPYCKSLNITEAPAPVIEQGEITAWISVLHADVNAKLSEGYVILDAKDKAWAKECLMVKRAAPKQETQQ